MHTVLLMEYGRVYTMGRNSEGQLGVGHTNGVEQPTLVEFITHRTVVVNTMSLKQFILNKVFVLNRIANAMTKVQ